jgi:hypothetical protein
MPEAEPQDAGPVPPITGDVTIPFTCPWAQDNLRKAMEGMIGDSSGVLSYGVGSRHLRYKDAASQQGPIAYWDKMCQLYCPDYIPLPNSLTGVDTAFRVIERDV